jgi:hypothetical protein
VSREIPNRKKSANPYCPHFQTKIDDFGLKYCILKENPKNSISGSKR